MKYVLAAFLFAIISSTTLACEVPSAPQCDGNEKTAYIAEDGTAGWFMDCEDPDQVPQDNPLLHPQVLDAYNAGQRCVYVVVAHE